MIKKIWRILTISILGFLVYFVGPQVAFGLEAPFNDVPGDFSEQNLVGVWRTSYGGGATEEIQLFEDLTYRQIVTYRSEDGNKTLTVSDEWHLEKLGDGRVYLHLGDAQFFPSPRITWRIEDFGEECGETASDCPYSQEEFPIPFYDPVGDETIYMTDEVVLNVRLTRSGGLVLLPMWTSPDRGFPLLGAELGVFKK